MSAQSAYFITGRLRNNPVKKCSYFSEEHTSFGTNSTSTVHEGCIASSKHPRKLNTIQVKSSHQRSPYTVKFEDRSPQEIERQERSARGSSSSSSLASPTSSSQEAVTLTKHPASTRSESVSDEVRGDSSRGPAETENPNKNDDEEEVRRNLSHDLPEWLQENRHGLADESVPKHRDASSSSHESPSEPRAKVVSGKHSILTHFTTDRNCHICLRTKITRAS